VKKMRVTVNGVCYEVEVEMVEDDEQPGTSYATTSPQAHPAAPSPARPMPAPPPPRPAAAGSAGVVDSPIAGIVVEVKVKPGDTVTRNQPLLIIEAMKMNTGVNSPMEGRIAQVMVKAGDNVVQGQPLVKFE
jgi:biotin carboxyl carrier protein